jgi:hypothetical protein
VSFVAVLGLVATLLLKEQRVVVPRGVVAAE